MRRRSMRRALGLLVSALMVMALLPAVAVADPMPTGPTTIWQIGDWEETSTVEIGFDEFSDSGWTGVPVAYVGPSSFDSANVPQGIIDSTLSGGDSIHDKRGVPELDISFDLEYDYFNVVLGLARFGMESDIVVVNDGEEHVIPGYEGGVDGKWTSYNLDLGALPAGSHEITISFAPPDEPQGNLAHVWDALILTGDQQPVGEITSPVGNSHHVVGSIVELEADYYDDNPGGLVYWAVRADNSSCTDTVNQVWGNVNGDSDPYTWTATSYGMKFLSSAPTTGWVPGEYCFVFNPGAGDPAPGEVNVREIARFWVDAPPVSDPNGPYAGVFAAPVTFDGSGSSDVDGTIVDYAWDFGDPYAADDTGSGVAPTHTYATEGTYTVTLTVTDDDGHSDTATTTAAIGVAPWTIEDDCEGDEFFVNSRGGVANSPTLEVGNLYTITARGTYYAGGAGLYDIQADAKYSQDRDQRKAGDPWTDSVNGYGSWGPTLLELFAGAGETPMPVDWGIFSEAHTYSIEMVGAGVPAQFQFSIYDTYPSNNTGGLCVAAVLLNEHPTADIGGPYSVDEGLASSVTLDASGSVDVDGTIVLYEWDLDNDGFYDDATGVTVSFSYDDGPSSPTVGLRVTDNSGLIDTDTTNVTVNNVAPTATFNHPADVDEGDSFTLSLTGPSDPSVADTTAGFTYAFDCGDGYGTFSSANTATCATAVDSGPLPVKGTIKDKDGGFTEYTGTVTVNNVAPVVEIDIDTQTVQYSDYIEVVTITATDVAADTMSAAVSGEPLSVVLSSTPTCTVAAGVKTCTWTLDGQIDVSALLYDVTVTVTDDDGGTGTVETDIEVVAEAATIEFDSGNPVAVEVSEPDGDSGLFSLTVYVTETTPDLPFGSGAVAPGDIDRAVVSMTLAPVGPGSPMTATCVPGAVTGIGYLAELPVVCSFDGVPVNTYTVEATVDGGYYNGYNEDVLVVYDPSLGFTTGGGWFYWPGTDDPESGYLGDKTNFGYNMKYKKTSKVQGSFLLIRHLEDGTKYRVKSNALYGLAIGAEDDFGWAAFSGKATYAEPGWIEPIGNHEFVVYVEDYGEPGVNDRIWLEMHDKSGDVINALSMGTGAQVNATMLDGGNIVVPHK